MGCEQIQRPLPDPAPGRSHNKTCAMLTRAAKHSQRLEAQAMLAATHHHPTLCQLTMYPSWLNPCVFQTSEAQTNTFSASSWLNHYQTNSPPSHPVIQVRGTHEECNAYCFRLPNEARRAELPSARYKWGPTPRAPIFDKGSR